MRYGGAKGSAVKRASWAGTHPLRERGAAAVEFALVMPILMLLVFGIIQYGFYFNDSFNVRQGVREGARAGVVESFGCPSAVGNSARLACSTREYVGALGGTTYVRVAAPDGWAKGKALRVCVQTKTAGGVGLLPMPNDGWVQSRIDMRIEQESQKATWTTHADTLPSGQSWSWCA